MYLPLRSLALVALLASPWTISRAQSDAPATPQEKPPDTLTFRTTVRRVLVDIVYTGWFKVQTNDGPQWRRRLEPHRLVLQREKESYSILSGM